MEYLRFGSSIPGHYWGCCCADIAQDFKVNPKDKASIQLTSGDSGMALMNEKQELLFFGPTYEDIFWSRYRIGTFSRRDMPNHAIFAILTDHQLKTKEGLAWLKILKEAGFEFVRTVSNSVSGGPSLLSGQPQSPGIAQNHVFACFRNIGTGAVKDPFTPPKAWTDLKAVMPEAWEKIPVDERQPLEVAQRKAHTEIWNKCGPSKFLTEKDLKKAGAPVVMAGQRLPHAQPELKKERDQCKEKAVPHKFSFKAFTTPVDENPQQKPVAAEIPPPAAPTS